MWHTGIQDISSKVHPRKDLSQAHAACYFPFTDPVVFERNIDILAHLLHIRESSFQLFSTVVKVEYSRSSMGKKCDRQIFPSNAAFHGCMHMRVSSNTKSMSALRYHLYMQCTGSSFYS